MKKIIVVFSAVLLTVSGFAQKTADLGIWGGTSTYIGDYDKAFLIQGFNPNFGAYFRYNFNSRIGMRFMFLTGKSEAKGTFLDLPVSYPPKSIQDVSLQVEINYLRFITGLKNTRFTPYIMSGIGLSYFRYNLTPTNSLPVVSPNIPFGFGVKYNLGKRLSVGAEYQIRKLFSDKLDDLNDPLAFNILDPNDNTIILKEVKYTTTYHNNDWPGYLGAHLTYMIYIGRKACPAYDSKVK